MILAVAERVNNPRLTDQAVLNWQRVWQNHRLGAIRHTPAMTRGSTLTRLRNLIGVRPDKVVNLLRPDNKIGSWDEAEARVSATQLKLWLERRSDITGVVLLGQRVVRAFYLNREEWGEMVDVPGLPPLLLMPHPSGRNRILNDPAFTSRLRRSARLFAKMSEV